jgi:hypothetical protein
VRTEVRNPFQLHVDRCGITRSRRCVLHFAAHRIRIQEDRKGLRIGKQHQISGSDLNVFLVWNRESVELRKAIDRLNYVYAKREVQASDGVSRTPEPHSINE